MSGEKRPDISFGQLADALSVLTLPENFLTLLCHFL
jgi:hypothetical protein